jgi:hypothetical protein
MTNQSTRKRLAVWAAVAQIIIVGPAFAASPARWALTQSTTGQAQQTVLWGGEGRDRSGSGPTTVPQYLLKKNAPNHMWNFPVGVTAQPLVIDLGDGHGDLIIKADLNGVITALIAATGKQLWQFKVPPQLCKAYSYTNCPAGGNGVMATPVIDPNGIAPGLAAIYVAAFNYMVKLDVRTGQPAPSWSAQGMQLIPPGEGAGSIKASLNLIDDPDQPTSPALVLIGTTALDDTGAGSPADRTYHGMLGVIAGQKIVSRFYPMSGNESVPVVSGGSFWQPDNLTAWTHMGQIYIGYAGGNGMPWGTKQESTADGDHWVVLKYDPATQKLSPVSASLTSGTLYDTDAYGFYKINSPICPNLAVGTSKNGMMELFPYSPYLSTQHVTKIPLGTPGANTFLQIAYAGNDFYVTKRTRTSSNATGNGVVYHFNVARDCNITQAGEFLESQLPLAMPTQAGEFQFPMVAIGPDHSTSLIVTEQNTGFSLLNAKTGAHLWSVINPGIRGAYIVQNMVVAYGTGGVDVYQLTPTVPANTNMPGHRAVMHDRLAR